MKIVRVTYTVKPSFVEKNSENIKAVMNELRRLNRPGINYFTCLSADGKTFIHTAFHQSEEDQKALNDLEVFKQFQQELKASGLEVPPQQEVLTLIASSRDMF